MKKLILNFFISDENNPDVRETLFLFFPMTYEQVKSDVQSIMTSRENLSFTIVEKSTHQPVGQTSFVRIDYVSRMATFFLRNLGS